MLLILISAVVLAFAFFYFYIPLLEEKTPDTNKKDTRQFLVEKDPEPVKEKPAKKPRKPRTKKAKPE